MGIAGAVSTVRLRHGRPSGLCRLRYSCVSIFATRAPWWFLQRIDAELQARLAGVATAVPRLRALHVKGMLANALQLVAVVGSVPLIAG